MLKMIKNQREFDLFNTIKNIEKDQYRREYEQNHMEDPFLIVRAKETDFENTVKVEKYEKAKENMGKENGEGIIQRYIRSRGRNRELDVNAKKMPLIGQKIYISPRSNLMKENENDSDQIRSRGESQESMHIPENMNESNVSNFLPNNGMINNFSNFNEMNSNYYLNLIQKNQIKQKSKLALKNITEEKKRSYTKPTVIRLVFKTRYNPSKKPNLAYCLINKEFVESLIKSSKKEISLEKFTQFCTLQTTTKETFDIYVMAGESLKPYEFYANEIIIYVQKLYKFLLKTIVIDFIKDERGIIYFLGVKYFEPVKEPEDIIPEYNYIDLTEEKNIKKLYKTWTCKLCLLAYPKAKITKVVTFKLVVTLKENLEKRGKRIFNHILNNGLNESSSCRVCDLCYKLLITEQEIMEILKTIAICNNIPVQSDEQLSKKSKAPENMIRIPHKIQKVNQWRILFYFVRFYMLETDKINFNENVNFKLYIKLFDQKIGIPIFTDIEKFKSSNEVEINLSKIFYFFTTENSNLKQILKNEEVDFRIVVNDDYHYPLAQCLTTCLSFYENETATKTARVKNTLNFFSNNLKFFKCQVYVGLNNDGEILAENIPLYNFKNNNSIYLTDYDYFSYHPLPDDWQELFIPPDSNVDDFQDYKLDKLIDDIILDLDFQGKKKKKEKENNEKGHEIYDPYDALVQIQEKNILINKIKSIPVVQDLKYVDKNKINVKTRPQTALLETKFKKDIYAKKNKDKEFSKQFTSKKNSDISPKSSSSSSDNKKKPKNIHNIFPSFNKKMDTNEIEDILGKIDKHMDSNFK